MKNKETITKNKPQDKKQEGRYGLLSMIAMIIGIVVAAGIFIKNGEIYDDSQSAVIAITGWIVGGLLILIMVFAFIEISSSTKLSNKAGTLSTWGTNFIGPNTGLVIGIFFLFVYFPLVIAGLSFYAADFLLAGIGSAVHQGYDPNTQVLTDSQSFIILTILGFTFFFSLFVMNMTTFKSGKLFQDLGTIIKFIPIIFIILLAFLVGLTIIRGVDTNSIFDPDINQGLSEGFFRNFLIILPAVLFSFDGFLFANSVSTEAKSPKTYKKALLISIFAIVAIYIFFTISIFYLAGSDADFTLSGAIANVFPNAWWLIMITNIILMISILTAVNGLIISTLRNVPELSRNNLINDRNGKFLRRNNVHICNYSAYFILTITIVLAVFIRSFDAMALFINRTESSSDLAITAFATSISALFAFGLYGVILIGGMHNRRVKKVEVEKVKGFMIYSTIAVISLFFASASIFAILFIVPLATHHADVVYWVELFFFIFIFTLWVGVFSLFTFEKKHKPLTPAEQKQKESYIEYYDKILPYSEFKKK